MYISQECKRNNGYKSDNNVTHIEPDKLSALKKKLKKQEKKLRKWEVYATQCVGPKQQKLQYTDVRVMMKDLKTGKGKMLWALLDVGCTKSIILERFTSPKV